MAFPPSRPKTTEQDKDVISRSNRDAKRRILWARCCGSRAINGATGLCQLGKAASLARFSSKPCQSFFAVTVFVDDSRLRFRKRKLPKLATRGRLMNVVTDCKHKSEKLSSKLGQGFAGHATRRLLSPLPQCEVCLSHWRGNRCFVPTR